MPLPPAVQEFGVNAEPYLAGIDSMVEATDNLAASIDEVIALIGQMGGSLDSTSVAGDRLAETEDTIAAAADHVATAVGDLGTVLDATAAAFDANSAAVDANTAALDANAGSAVGARESTTALGGHGKLALIGLAVALGYSVDKAAKFQAEMAKLNTQAGVSRAKLGVLGQGVLKLAGQIGMSPDSLTESLYHVESNFESLGITAPKALRLVKIAAEGANVGGADLVDVTNALTAAVASGIPGVQNMGQAMGALNAVVGAGDMTMQDLADAMGTGMVAVVKGYGLSLRDVGAALAVFGDNNIRGAKAGTDLRMAVQAMAVPMKTGADELAKLGMNSGTLAKDMRQGGLIKALDDFSGRMHKAGITAKEQGQYITAIFGKKAGAGLSVLLDQMDRIRSKYPALAKGAHEFGSAWKHTQETVQQKMKEFRGSLDALAVSFGQVLLPYVTKVITKLNQFMGFLEKHPLLAKFAGAAVALAVTMGLLASAAGAVSTILAAWLPIAIVAGVVALAAGLYELYKHCKTVRDIVHDVAAFFKTAWSVAVHAAGAVVHWFVTGPLAFIKQQMKVFEKFWAQNGKEIEKIVKVAWDFISGVIKGVWDGIQGSIKIGLDIIKTVWKVTWAIISNVVKTVWSLIATVVSTVIHEVLDVIQIVLDLIQGHWKKAWNTLKDLVGTALHAAIKVIKTIASGFWHLLYSAGKAIIQGLINGIKSMIGAVWGVIKDIGHGIASAFKSVLHIFSPSRVTYDLGVQTAAGLALGMKDSTASVTKSARSLAEAAYWAARNAAEAAKERLKTMRSIGLGLRAGIIKDLEGTASSVKSAIGKLETMIRDAVRVGDISYGKGLTLTDWLQRENGRLQRLADQRERILKRIQAAKKYAQTTTQNLESFAGLSNLSSVQNAQNGGALYSGDMLANLKSSLSQIKRFGAALKRLKKLGLAKGLLDQIVQMGPDQGLQVAEALLEGPVSVIRQLDSTQSQINKASRGIGRQAADEMYDSGKAAGKGFLKGLEEQQKHLERLMARIAKAMIRSLRRELGLGPGSPGRHHMHKWAESLAAGIDDGEAKVSASRSRLTAALAGPAQAAGGAGATVVNNYHFEPHIELSGVIASDRAQIRAILFPIIQEAALQFERRNGNAGNGLSLANARFG